MYSSSPKPWGAIAFWILSVLALWWTIVLFASAKNPINEVVAGVALMTAAVLGAGAALLYALFLIRLALWTAEPNADDAEDDRPSRRRKRDAQ